MSRSRSPKGRISFWKGVGWFLLLGIAGFGALHMTFTYRDSSHFWRVFAYFWAPAALASAVVWQASRQRRPPGNHQTAVQPPTKLPSPGAIAILVPMSCVATVGWSIAVDALATREMVNYKGEVVAKDRSWSAKGKSRLSITLQIPGASSQEAFPVGRAVYDSATIGSMIEIQYRKGVLGFEKMRD